ncbi:uncharacterized protein LOC129726998 [Wyeomyia smithii]|uniref:uncharacterized protein LOC129726998 n=1 Tax=Wyeomyia smithii TaxID=174621 RepID=UPI002467ED40|nr:uncharacterized protein LOC129726998 [Wyeomyia smithii]
MTSLLYRFKYSWEIVDGDQHRQVAYSLASSGAPISISQDDLLNPDGCLVLESGEDQSFCEQVLSVHPGYHLTAIALIAECCTIESYIGKAQEYNHTYHGDLIFDGESRLYRFDILFDANEGPSDVTLRFIVPSGANLCLYGTHLILVKNSNSLGSEVSLNQAMLECHLDDEKLSEKAAKAKAFLLASMGKHLQQPHAAVQIRNTLNNNTDLYPDAGDDHIERRDIEPDKIEPHQPPEFSSLFGELLVKQYIDKKLTELEGAIDIKLKAMEVRQNQKLDKIISLLEFIENKQ